MTIVGFNFNKIDVHRTKTSGGKINISNNVTIKDVTDTDLSLGSETQKAVRFEFEFISKYDPNIGKILLGGDVLFLANKDKTKAILDDWKKNKKVEKDLMSSVLNTVLTKSNVQALILSQEVNLPSPMPMPKVQVDNPKEK